MSAYAKIFIDRPDGSLGVLFEIQDAVEARRRSVVVEGRDVEVELRRNPDAGQADGFLGFPLIAEVAGDEDTEERVVVQAVATLTTALERAGFSYATAADFEDELPARGRNIPL